MVDRRTSRGRSNPPARSGGGPSYRASRGRLRARRGNYAPDRVGLAIVAIVLAVIAIAGVFVWGYQVFSARIDAVKRIDRATALIEEADVTVVRVDSVIRERVTPELAQGARAAQERVPGAQQQLRQAVRSLEEARAKASPQDRERAELLLDAAGARLTMLERARSVLALNVAASEALPLADEGWDAVIAADRFSDKAVAAYNKLTKTGVKASRGYNKQAADQLATARARFAGADAAFPQAPFEQYLAYVDARIRLNELSQQSDAAWLAGNVKKANSVAKTYNAEDKKAVALARDLPASPDKAIAEAYEKAAEESTDGYYRARDAATKADAGLRSQ